MQRECNCSTGVGNNDGASCESSNGFWCFDPGVLVDDDGQSYIYFGGGSVDDNTRVMKLGSDKKY
jgi:arabinoxylan arabinofuranohydrolase